MKEPWWRRKSNEFNDFQACCGVYSPDNRDGFLVNSILSSHGSTIGSTSSCDRQGGPGGNHSQASFESRAAVVSLSIAAAPFVARVIETSLKEVDPGVIQAAKAMGSTNWQIIVKVMLPEALPSLVSGVTLTIINLIGYSAMAGTIGGGGLGDLAIRYGYQRFRSDVMFGAVVVTIVLVELVQFVGNKISSRLLAKR